MTTRTHRASVAAIFAYLQFALSIVVGIVLVPFVLAQVGAGIYGFWLASGEVLAYAAMADLGALGVVPWMVAQADGRGDRDAIRRLVSTGLAAGLVVSFVYLALVAILWQVAPAVLNLGPAERAIVIGPLAIVASVTAAALPLRVFNATLVGLQDVRFYGVMTTAGWAVNVITTVLLLWKGYGLYALAVGSMLPALAGAIACAIRLHRLAPDLLTGLVFPARRDVAALFREGFGSWLGAWGWRLSAATDAIVLAALGSPVAVTQLAVTAKLGTMFTAMAWVPGDSGLVGLAQLEAEGSPERLRAAVTAVIRVYLSLAAAGACVILAANPAFVRGWLGEPLFAGFAVNAAVAAVVIALTASHALIVVTGVLGERLRVGLYAFVAGCAQVALAVFLGARLGTLGVPLAAVCAHLLLLAPMLLAPLKRRTGVGATALATAAIRPWAARVLPALAICAVLGRLLWPLPIWGAIAGGALVGLALLWVLRTLILEYAPVAALVRSRLAALRLETLLPAPRLEP